MGVSFISVASAIGVVVWCLVVVFYDALSLFGGLVVYNAVIVLGCGWLCCCWWVWVDVILMFFREWGLLLCFSGYVLVVCGVAVLLCYGLCYYLMRYFSW